MEFYGKKRALKGLELAGKVCCFGTSWKCGVQFFEELGLRVDH